MSEKALDIDSQKDLLQRGGKPRIIGNSDDWQLLCKVSDADEGWMKSTKALQVPNGCLVQTSTQQRNPDGSYAIAEAVAFVPLAALANDVDGAVKLVRG